MYVGLLRGFTRQVLIAVIGIQKNRAAKCRFASRKPPC